MRDFLEAAFLVQGHARRIRQSDHAKRGSKGHRTQSVEKSEVKLRPQAAASHSFLHVDGGFDEMDIRRALAEIAGVCIADDRAAMLRSQPWETLCYAGNALRHFRNRDFDF